MSQGGQLQPELNGVDMLFKLTSIILEFGGPINYIGKSRIGSSTLTSSEIATEN